MPIGIVQNSDYFPNILINNLPLACVVIVVIFNLLLYPSIPLELEKYITYG